MRQGIFKPEGRICQSSHNVFSDLSLHECDSPFFNRTFQPAGRVIGHQNPLLNQNRMSFLFSIVNNEVEDDLVIFPHIICGHWTENQPGFSCSNGQILRICEIHSVCIKSFPSRITIRQPKGWFAGEMPCT